MVPGALSRSVMWGVGGGAGRGGILHPAASSEDVSGGVTGKEAHGMWGCGEDRGASDFAALSSPGPRLACVPGCDEPLSLAVTGRGAEGRSRGAMGPAPW